MFRSRYLLILLLLAGCLATSAQSIVTVRPLTDRIVVFHLTEGTIDHHGNGDPTSSDIVNASTINETAAGSTINYSIFSTDDEAYNTSQSPIRVNRKSKGTAFANCVNANVKDHVKEYWLYLTLPTRMIAGKTYEFTTSLLPPGPGRRVVWRYTPNNQISEVLHVNLTGYATAATQKSVYLHHWLGDGGGIDLEAYEGEEFRVIDADMNLTAFTGRITARKPLDNQTTFQNVPEETPGQNFLTSAVWEGDFSEFNTPGNYRIYIEGIGISRPFTIACNALQPAYRTTMKGLYHNRSGIALEAPYTNWTRPAPHNSSLTPGFAGKLVYSSATFCGASAEEPGPEGKEYYDNAVLGPLEASWGWYQDAGDWDAYISHLDVPTKLLFVYEHYPANFYDGNLNLPESGNGLPDVLDEARWLLRFYKRVKDETEGKNWTTGGVPGGRVFGDLWGNDLGTAEPELGRGSWQDNDRRWVVSGEDPATTYRYAAAAAQFAYLLSRDGLADPENIDWAAEATTTYAWAEARYDPAYVCHGNDVREYRTHAAAALFRLTGETGYDADFNAALTDRNFNLQTDELNNQIAFGPYIYLATEGGDPALKTAIAEAVERYANFILLTSAEQRGSRYGGNIFFPMLSGQPTTPYVFEGIMAHALLRETKPELAADYLEVLHSTADYFLGGNALNTTWVTGLNEYSPKDAFDLDSRYAGHDFIKPGVVPYGPWRDFEEFGNMGPFNHRWANKTVYPEIAEWPGHERWFSNRYAPVGGEYTIHQNTINAAVLYGVLANRRDCAFPVRANEARTQVQRLNLYPNPAEGWVTLDLPPGVQNLRVRLLDVRGREVTGFQEANGRFSVVGLPSGIYTVEAVTDVFRRVGRVVVR